MNGKIEQLRGLMAARADQLWRECITIEPLTPYDRVKVALENLVEGHYMVPNMWAPDFLAGVSIGSVTWLINAVGSRDVMDQINGNGRPL